MERSGGGEWQLEAFKTALLGATLTGRCAPFKDREEVFVTDTSLFSGLVQARRKGETAKY